LQAGADIVTELAFTIADGLEYVRTGIAAGISVDSLAPRFSFFFGIGKEFFVEVLPLFISPFFPPSYSSHFPLGGETPRGAATLG
jgi:hypothetical protein